MISYICSVWVCIYKYVYLCVYACMCAGICISLQVFVPKVYIVWILNHGSSSHVLIDWVGCWVKQLEFLDARVCESLRSVLCGATGLGEHYNTLGGNYPDLFPFLLATVPGTWTSHDIQDNQTMKEMMVSNVYHQVD